MAQIINSASDFDGVLRKAGDKLVVIDFTATWCGPCKAIAPVFESLAKTHAGNAHFLKVDVDQQQALAQRYSVRAMPTFLFMRQGNVLDTLRGANAGRLQSLTQQYIKGGSGSGSAFSGSGQTIGGTTVAPGSGLPNGGIFGQIPMENMMPFLIVIGYLAYVVYNNYIK